MQIEVDGIDVSTLEALYKFELCNSESIYEIKQSLNKLVCLLSTILVEDYIVVYQLQCLWYHVEKHESNHLSIFDHGPKFGLKFTYQN